MVGGKAAAEAGAGTHGAVRCSAFHEKAVKVEVRVGIGLPCGLGWWSMFRSNLPQKGGTLPSGYRSFFTSSRDASQSFRIEGPRLRCRSRKWFVVGVVFPQTQKQNR